MAAETKDVLQYALNGASLIAIGLKLLQSFSDSWKRLGRERRTKWLRQEITELSEFQKIVSAELSLVIDQQIQNLSKQYAELWKTPIRARHQPVYPTVTFWRRVFLLYNPARFAAWIPQLLFYFWIILAIAFWWGSIVSNAVEFPFVIVILLFSLPFRDWAKHAERPRIHRPRYEALFLRYKQPNKRAKVLKFLFYLYSLCALILPIEAELAPWLAGESGLDQMRKTIFTWLPAIIAVVVGLHDYARSFDEIGNTQEQQAH